MERSSKSNEPFCAFFINALNGIKRDIVWVLKDLISRVIWPPGRIVSLHPGPYGITRVCSVRTVYGTFERPGFSPFRVFAT